MTSATPETMLSLQLERVLQASPEQVFDAWTTPQALQRWFCPEGFTAAAAEVDLRVGGQYRLGMQAADGSLYYVSGTYRDIQRPARLAFTWVWAYEIATADEEQMLVTVELFGQGEATRLVLTHVHLPSAAAREQHLSGWEGCFDKLEHTLK